MGEDKGGLTPEQLAAARLRERADNVDRFLADNESERDGWLSSMPVAEMRRDAEELRSTADVLDAQAEEIERLKREKLELAGMVADLRDRVHDLEADSDHASGSAELAMHSLRSRLAEMEAENAKLREEIRTTLLAEEERRKLTGDALQAEGERHEAEKKLAEVEAECLEQARLHGMGSEREARLLAKLAEVERKVVYYESALVMPMGEARIMLPGEVPARPIDPIRIDELLSRLAESQAREARLRAALEKADEGLSHINRWAPVAADFEAGGKFDYAEGCGNADDAATLGAERCHFRLAEHARHALRAISLVLYGPAAPASDALDAVREAQRAGEALEKYGDDHEWGFMPVGVTLDRFQDALAALARVFGEVPR
jgi:hypothetical protein